jgi:hypothetical protein
VATSERVGLVAKDQNNFSRSQSAVPSPYYRLPLHINFFRDSEEIFRPGGLTPIKSTALPEVITNALSATQHEGLLFASREMTVTGDPKINTFQLGSATKGRGTVSSAGLDRALGQNWGAFGGLSTIDLNQQTVNAFRTDIQLRLEDVHTGEKMFLERSISLAVTISIDRGDTIKLYYLKGGLLRPTEGDFHVADWSPFAAENFHTNQIIPFAPVPSFAQKKVDRTVFWIVSIIMFPISWLIVPIVLPISIWRENRRWEENIKLSKEALMRENTTIISTSK